MKYTFNNRKEALQKVDAIPTPHKNTINHYSEEDKYIVNIEWKGTNLWKSKTEKNDKD